MNQSLLLKTTGIAVAIAAIPILAPGIGPATGSILLYDRVGDLTPATIVIKNAANSNVVFETIEIRGNTWRLTGLPEGWYSLYQIKTNQLERFPFTQWLPVYPGWETGWLRRNAEKLNRLWPLPDIQALPSQDPRVTEELAPASSPFFPGQGLAVLIFQDDGPVMIDGDLGGSGNNTAGRPCFQKPGSNRWVFVARLTAEALAGYTISTPLKERQPDETNKLDAGPLMGGSAVFLPESKIPRWITPAPAGRAGQVESFGVEGRQAGYRKNVTVWLPAGYPEEGRAYRTVYFQDAQMLCAINFTNLLDHYLAEQLVAPFVAVLIEQAGRYRPLEYVPFDEQTPAEHRSRKLFEDDYKAGKIPEWYKRLPEVYTDFLQDTLIPEIERRYSVSHAPADRGLAGGSYGSVINFFIMARHPGLFGRVACESMGPPKMDFSRIGEFPLKLWFSFGEYETSRGGILENFRNVEKIFADKPQVDLKTEMFQGGHSWTAWALEFPRIYRWWWPEISGVGPNQHNAGQ